MASRFDRFRSAIGLVGAAGIVLPMFDPAIAWFLVPAAIGGVAMAAVLLYVHRTNRFAGLEAATDAPDGLTLGMFNLSTVSPAGIGGLGLIVMAAVIAAQYQEIQFVLATGAIGGTAMAAWLIHRRRTDRATPALLPLSMTRR